MRTEVQPWRCCLLFPLFYCEAWTAQLQLCTVLVRTFPLHCPFSPVGSISETKLRFKRLDRSEWLARLTAANSVTVTTQIYESPVTLTKDTTRVCRLPHFRHRWESSLLLLIDWEENSLNSIFHLSQSMSKLSSPLSCPPVGEGMADATMASLLLPNKCPVAWHEEQYIFPLTIKAL